MIAHPECIPCLINQGLNAIRKLNLSRDEESKIVLEIVRYLSTFEKIDNSPAFYAYFVQELVKKHANSEDPFYDIKRASNKVAMELIKSLESVDLERALFLSGAGNAIDFAIRDSVDLNALWKEIQSMQKGRFDWDIFKEKLDRSKSILIIGDNAGEIVFDKILAQTLTKMGKEVIYAVKSFPILNDVLMQDAVEVEMDKVCKVIETGSGKVGTPLEDCSREFLQAFYEADMVISKGQANYETLSKADRDVFFLLTVKCVPVERETGSPKGSVCLMYHPGF